MANYSSKIFYDVTLSRNTSVTDDRWTDDDWRTDDNRAEDAYIIAVQRQKLTSTFYQMIFQPFKSVFNVFVKFFNW